MSGNPFDMQVLADQISGIVREAIAEATPKLAKQLQARIKSLEVRIRELETEQLSPRITQLEDLLTEPAADQ